MGTGPESLRKKADAARTEEDAGWQQQKKRWGVRKGMDLMLGGNESCREELVYKRGFWTLW